MQPMADRWSIVVRGAWNRAIFGPKWVSGTLAEGRPVTLEVPLDNISQGYRLVVDDVRLAVDSTRLELKPAETTDAALGAAQALADKILEHLPHTPVNAIGINFAFQESPPSAEHVQLFESVENDAISDLGYELAERSIGFSMSQPDDPSIVNVLAKLLAPSSTFIVDFNFHRPVGSTQECRTTLAQGLPAVRQRAIAILNSIYHATVDEGA